MSARMRPWTLLLTLVLVSASQPLRAQRVHLGVAGGSLRVLPVGDATTPALTGLIAGAEARITLGPVSADLWYLQGALSSADGAAARDLVEGTALVGVQPFPGLGVAVGPHVRAYVTPTGTQRWVLWEAHVRGAVEILPSVVEAYLTGSLVLAGNVSGAALSGRGMEGGLVVRLPAVPVWLRGGYRIERTRVTDDRFETIERLGLTLGVALW